MESEKRRLCENVIDCSALTTYVRARLRWTLSVVLTNNAMTFPSRITYTIPTTTETASKATKSEERLTEDVYGDQSLFLLPFK